MRRAHGARIWGVDLVFPGFARLADRLTGVYRAITIKLVCTIAVCVYVGMGLPVDAIALVNLYVKHLQLHYITVELLVLGSVPVSGCECNSDLTMPFWKYGRRT